jgi:transposase
LVEPELKEVPMGILGGFDLHRRQITFDFVDTDTGESSRGQIKPATRVEVREWLTRFDGRDDVAVVLEGTTGWRFVVEELRRAGVDAHVAEPAEARALKGTKRRAKTDRADARHLRDLLLTGSVPESWIPTDFIADLRSKVRLRKALVDQRSGWMKRVHAQLFQHGLPEPPHKLDTVPGRLWLANVELPPTARQVVDVACDMIDTLDAKVHALDRELKRIARLQQGCVVLQQQVGVGPIISASMLAELGDVTRFSSSRRVVRFAGIDVTVSESDGKRRRGHLSRQGAPVLRWAAYAAAAAAWRTMSPDHDYYVATNKRLGMKRARLSVGRRILRRSYHLLFALGEGAIEPV